jgi:hypothetical protein
MVLPVRATTGMDDPAIAALLTATHVGTIDFDPDADSVDEVMTWRPVDDADDEASAVAVSGGEIVGASLVGRELGTPFLYEIVVAPQYRRGWDRPGAPGPFHRPARRPWRRGSLGLGDGRQPSVGAPPR